MGSMGEASAKVLLKKILPVHYWNLTLSPLAIYFNGGLGNVMDISMLRPFNDFYFI
jgi:lipoprotein signal peptidase